MHFEAINTPVKVPSNFLTTISSEKNKYNSALEMYASSLSIIDKIADSPVKESQISYQETELDDFVNVPIMVNLTSRIKERVTNINRFFIKDSNNVSEAEPMQEDGNLNAYILSIMNIDVANAIPPQQNSIRSASRSRSK
jgi:hypothetical protein